MLRANEGRRGGNGMRRWGLVPSVALLAVAGVVSSVAAAQQRPGVAAARSQAPGHVVVALGREYWEANAFVGDSRCWEPGTITVSSGDTITFEHGNTGPEPHTVTLATKAQLPHSFESCNVPC